MQTACAPQGSWGFVERERGILGMEESIWRAVPPQSGSGRRQEVWCVGLHIGSSCAEQAWGSQVVNPSYTVSFDHIHLSSKSSQTPPIPIPMSPSPSYPPPSTFQFSSSCLIPPLRVWYRCPIYGWTLHRHSLHIDSLWVSVLNAICGWKTLLWWGPRVALSREYGNERFRGQSGTMFIKHGNNIRASCRGTDPWPGL